MPQLDKLSFLNQLIWFFFFYIIFYFLMIKTFIPTIGRSLKLRAKLLNSLTSNTNKTTNEAQTVIKIGLDINQNMLNMLTAVIKNTAFNDAFLNILNQNAKIQSLKNVYVKELSKILAKKKVINKK